MGRETSLQNELRLALHGIDPGARLMRNNNGVLQDRFGSYVAYGLGPGTSDLIGWASRVVTPDMVGRRLAIFLAVEVKRARSRTSPQRLNAQTDFLAAVCAAGGLGGFATGRDDLVKILNQTPC